MTHPKLQPALEGLVTWILSFSARRLSVIGGAVLVGAGAAVYATATAYGRAMASQVVQELARPVTDSLSSRIDQHDTVLAVVTKMVRQQGHLQERSIAAMRESMPRYDSALRAQVEDSEARRRRDLENRELMRALSETIPAGLP